VHGERRRRTVVEADGVDPDRRRPPLLEQELGRRLAEAREVVRAAGIGALEGVVVTDLGVPT
jgi:hypothetical protein